MRRGERVRPKSVVRGGREQQQQRETRGIQLEIPARQATLKESFIWKRERNTRKRVVGRTNGAGGVGGGGGWRRRRPDGNSPRERKRDCCCCVSSCAAAKSYTTTPRPSAEHQRALILACFRPRHRAQVCRSRRSATENLCNTY